MLVNMKIGSRIVLALTLPILGLLLFSAYSIWQKHLMFSEMDALQRLAGLAPTISGVVHELQKERGTTALYIGSNGAKFFELIPEQQKNTNQAMEKLDTELASLDSEHFGQHFTTRLDSAKEALDGLALMRNRVDTFSISVPDMAAYYTQTIAKLIYLVEEMAVISTNADVTKTIAAYTSFLQAKERAGQERTMGGAGFGAGQFAPDIHRRFVELIAEQNVLLTQFAIYANESQRQALENTVRGADIDEVERMREIAVNSPHTGTTDNVEGPYWYETITQKIEHLKKVEDVISRDLSNQTNRIKDAARDGFYLFLVSTLVLLGVTAGLVTLIVKGITGPVLGLTGTMRTLADGDTSVEVSGTERGDEIGAMSTAVEVFKMNMIKNQELAAQQERENAAKEEKRVALENLARTFETSVTSVLGHVNQASGSMQSTAESMAATAEQTSKQSSVVANAAQEASSNVQTVASAAEELSSSISEISRQVAQSTQIAGTAVSEVDGANDKVQSLAQAATKIGEVVALITDIADQTNLLALNATIEAARAGEAGKGFAVVASEVKNLANQTAKATEEISSQIGGIQGATQDAVQAIGSIGGIINQMNEITSTIAAAVEEQGAATQEIARNVEQASSGTSDVTTNIAGVSQAANDTGQAAEKVLTAVGTLTGESSKLSDEVQDFLHGLKRIG